MWCSDLSYLTCFLNNEVNYFKMCEFGKVNLVIQKLSQIRYKKKLELLKVPVLLVITGKPQTLARNISGMRGRICIRLFYFSSSAALSHT